MRRALLAALYALGVLVFLEGSLRLAFASDAIFRLVASDDDASWRLTFVHNHAHHRGPYEGVDAYSPSRGWSPRPDLRAVPLRGGRVSTNSRGLRGRREYPYAKPPGTTRIVALGDSFTFGEEVDDADTFAERLAGELPGVEVLNLGVHGYGHDQMLLYLQEEGLRYEPDVVLLGFVAVDMARDERWFRDFAKPRFVLDDGALSLRNTPVPSPESVLAHEIWRPRLLDVLVMLRERVRVRTGAAHREREALTLALLERVRETAEAARATPVFLYVPVGGEIAQPEPSKHRRWLLAYCERHGLVCVDPSDVFHAHLEAGDPLKTVGHWDAKEHALAAEAIAAALRARHLVPSPLAPRADG